MKSSALGESEMGSHDEDYEVGYKKPPVEHRFRKGVSPNPKGRPRGAYGIKAELRRELNEVVHVPHNGKVMRLAKKRIMLKSLVANAAKGDLRATNLVIQWMIQLENLEPKAPPGRLSAADQQILDRLLSGTESTEETNEVQGSD